MKKQDLFRLKLLPFSAKKVLPSHFNILLSLLASAAARSSLIKSGIKNGMTHVVTAAVKDISVPLLAYDAMNQKAVYIRLCVFIVIKT